MDARYHRLTMNEETWRVMVDGGGETWPTLSDLVSRRLAELSPGDILHVISEEPTVHPDIARWCLATGHDLLLVRHDADGTRFWIRKGGWKDHRLKDASIPATQNRTERTFLEPHHQGVCDE
ncbi:MAG TPA: sulfurtransferase TusA family protein [Chloroflexota bacterium]|nr:sulfurtransferase TusA family protein [Chloroflexota bacterium]